MRRPTPRAVRSTYYQNNTHFSPNSPTILYGVTNGNCLWQPHFLDIIGFLDNGCHQKQPISISATLLSKCCSTVPHPPQGHAIQSDWRHDEELAELMGSTCLLFIMARRGFRRKWTSLLADAFISKWGDVSCKIQIITKLINLEFMNTGILSIQWNPEWLMFTTNWKDFWQRTLLL